MGSEYKPFILLIPSTQLPSKETVPIETPCYPQVSFSHTPPSSRYKSIFGIFANCEEKRVSRYYLVVFPASAEWWNILIGSPVTRVSAPQNRAFTRFANVPVLRVLVPSLTQGGLMLTLTPCWWNALHLRPLGLSFEGQFCLQASTRVFFPFWNILCCQIRKGVVWMKQGSSEWLAPSYSAYKSGSQDLNHNLSATPHRVSGCSHDVSLRRCTWKAKVKYSFAILALALSQPPAISASPSHSPWRAFSADPSRVSSSLTLQSFPNPPCRSAIVGWWHEPPGQHLSQPASCDGYLRHSSHPPPRVKSHR